MTKPKFKYHINHQISLLPREITITDIEKTLLNDHGINRDAFYRDRNIEVGSTTSIPSDRLDAYAIVFGCTTDELKNYKVKGKSLVQKFSKAKTGLRTVILFIALSLLMACQSSNFTCADYAAGKGSKNQRYAEKYKRHFSHHDTSIKRIGTPRI